nr:MAG TPA: hypothetical protein [Caudoviricetes sp.]
MQKFATQSRVCNILVCREEEIVCRVNFRNQSTVQQKAIIPTRHCSVKTTNINKALINKKQ